MKDEEFARREREQRRQKMSEFADKLDTDNCGTPMSVPLASLYSAVDRMEKENPKAYRKMLADFSPPPNHGPGSNYKLRINRRRRKRKGQ